MLRVHKLAVCLILVTSSPYVSAMINSSLCPSFLSLIVLTSSTASDMAPEIVKPMDGEGNREAGGRRDNELNSLFYSYLVVHIPCRPVFFEILLNSLKRTFPLQRLYIYYSTLGLQVSQKSHLLSQKKYV